jgi:hypothetical protein
MLTTFFTRPREKGPESGVRPIKLQGRLLRKVSMSDVHVRDVRLSVVSVCGIVRMSAVCCLCGCESPVERCHGP